MHVIAKVFLGAAALGTVAVVAYAQGMNAASAPSMANVSVNDPLGPVPDPSHIPFVPADKIVWTGNPNGEQQAKLFGDASKPGLYGILLKWAPGASSRPHFHDQDRFIYVISGTWWVGSSSHFDPKLSYPMTAGTYVEDVANTVHWDGARAGGPPAIMELVGMGPVKTTQVDDAGNPLPPRQPQAGR